MIFSFWEGENNMGQIQWSNLLCEKRQRMSTTRKEPDANSGINFVTRNEFEADYDRIVGSSSVRRLQDKAQVFPLQKNDVVRTRLTHSIGVSAIARSLAKTVGLELEKRLFIVRKIWNETGLDEGVRHPATYLLEAADDIVYLCDDIEDG